MPEEKTDSSEAGKANVAGAPTGEPTAALDANRDEFDPAGWVVPVICKDCNQAFELPYRHFQAGVVFHCPHCHGSFVPNLPMYRAVHEIFEFFYAKRRRNRDAARNGGSDDAALRAREASELASFRRSLDELARTMRPAGKMVKRKGLAAMFT